MFHVKRLSINILEVVEYWHVSCRCARMSPSKMLDKYCQTSTIIAGGVNGWIDWGFWRFAQIVSTFVSCAIFIPFFCLIYFTWKPQWFQWFTDFSSCQTFWHAPCNTYNRTRTQTSNSLEASGLKDRILFQCSSQWGSFWHTFPYASEFVETKRRLT
jgi:hypothetical protein